MSEKKKLLSIVIPVYNVEKHIQACLDSVLKQTYKHLEIILVNDSSLENENLIIKNYMEVDPRIHLIQHSENKGLFAARITGATAATGDYIAFLDSDDTVLPDYYRLLVERAQKTKADIVMAKIINSDAEKKQYVHNLDPKYVFDILEGSKIKEHYFGQEGSNFIWHVVWNKLYSAELWNRCLPYFKQMQAGVTMTEDIAYSTVFFSMAQRLAYLDHYGVVYYRHANAATSIENAAKKIEKNLHDLACVFSFIDQFLKDIGVYTQYKGQYERWKLLYFKIWSGNIQTLSPEERSKYERKLLEIFGKEELAYTHPIDFFPYSITSEWDSRYEYLKSLVMGNTYDIISFDIFDTLVLRPLLEPADLYILMEPTWWSICPEKSNIRFSEARILSETLCRQEIGQRSVNFQDVTLDEIYEVFKREFALSDKAIDALRQAEIELEIKLCTPRQSIKELFEAALYTGKTIICISDMYLHQETIEQILLNAGYNNIEKVYVSSKYRLLKRTGLFNYVAKDIGLEKKDLSRVLHIGDNWHSDYEAAQAAGYSAFFYPKAADAARNIVNEIFTGQNFKPWQENLTPLGRTHVLDKFVGLRCMVGMVVRRFYDMPFIQYNSESDFNAEPYFLGYSALGPHVLAVAKWLYDQTADAPIDTLHFIARDGILFKQAFDQLCTIRGRQQKSNYLQASRSILLPCSIQSEGDLYGLSNQINIHSHSPATVCNLLQPLMNEVDQTQLEKLYLDNGIVMNSRFEDQKQFQQFIKQFIALSFDPQKAATHQKKYQKYYRSVISPNDALFDVGYSGRIQSHLMRITGYPAKVFYIHGLSDDFISASEKMKFSTSCFYDVSPAVSGSVREYFISEYCPPCIAIQPQTGVPVFSNDADYIKPVQEQYILNQIQKGALDFVSDFLNTFSEYPAAFRFRPQDASIPFEQFLARPKAFDRRLFEQSYMDDFVYGAVTKLPLLELWEMERSQAEMQKLEQLIVPIREIYPENRVEHILPPELEEIYADGLFMAFYKKINEKYPKGSKKRNYIKKFLKLFIK